MPGPEETMPPTAYGCLYGEACGWEPCHERDQILQKYFPGHLTQELIIPLIPESFSCLRIPDENGHYTEDPRDEDEKFIHDLWKAING